MKLFDMYALVGYVANKDYEGNVVTPEDFKRLAKVANLDLFKIKMGLPEDMAPGQPLTRQHPDVRALSTDELRFLKVYAPTTSVVAGKIAYPVNYFALDDIRYNYQRNIDGAAAIIPRKVTILKEQQYTDRASTWLKRPTLKWPVGVIRADGIHIYPGTITQVEMDYYRYPVEPVFAYTPNVGYITDPGTSVEFEWPESMHNDLMRIILSYIGVNIRDTELVQYAEQKKAQGV